MCKASDWTGQRPGERQCAAMADHQTRPQPESLSRGAAVSQFLTALNDLVDAGERGLAALRVSALPAGPRRLGTPPPTARTRPSTAG